MNNHIYQPMIFNPEVSVDSIFIKNVHPENAVSTNMFIYQADKTSSESIVPDSSVLFPSTHTQWIMGYNHSDNAAVFYCIGPVTKRRNYSFKNYDTTLVYALMIYVPTLQKESLLTHIHPV